MGRAAGRPGVAGNTARAGPVPPGVLPTRLVSTLASAALAAGLLVTPLLGGASPTRAANPRAATVQKVFPSAVRLQLTVAGEIVRSASGIAFARRGGSTYVLTNAHVVEPAKDWRTAPELRVLPYSGAPAVAKVVARGRVPDVDLAVVEVPGELPVTPLAPDDALELGDDLVVIGAPFGKGLSVAAGIVSQVEYDHAENADAPRSAVGLKTDAAIGYGSSGGGVFDVEGGRLVGVVEGYRTARVAFGEEYHFDVPMPGETFVAPAAKIRRFLRDSGLGDLALEPVRAPGAVAAPVAPRL
jgi:S1-C subfamily serine protease